MKRGTVILALGAVLALTAGCEFLSSAFERTFGDDYIPNLEFDELFPSVDELSELSGEELGELPGFPSSLAQGTLAHLQGALTVQGTCRHEQVMDPEQGNPVDQVQIFSITTCRGEERCKAFCPGDQYGMQLDMRVPVVLVDETQAEEIRESMMDVDADSIVQIRFRFDEFAMFQTLDGQEELITHLFDSVGVVVEDEAEPANVVTLVEPGLMPPVTEEAPQRFDLDSNSELTRLIKDQLLEAQPIVMTIGITMWIPQAHLYLITNDEAGVRATIQPEIVINVLEAVKSKI